MAHGQKVIKSQSNGYGLEDMLYEILKGTCLGVLGACQIAMEYMV